jgi:crotonobetainyl-CoA:carnitine CoA-transferase CaiB-like acyl-CoA transferase
MDVLSDLRVIEFASEISGPYCGKLFADAGADVIKVEPPEGDAFRRRTVHGEHLADGEDHALFRFLNQGKRSVVGAAGDPEVDKLVASADIVIDDGRPAHLDHAALRARYPRLVIVSITPYGRENPWEDRPATEFIVQAEGGGIAGRGLLDRPPHQAGGRLSEWITGAYAGVGALSSALHARWTGRGEVVDVANVETVNLAYTVFRELMAHLTEGGFEGVPRRVERPSIEPTLDGWAGFNTNTRSMFDSFLILIDRADLIDGEDNWASPYTRIERGQEWDELVAEQTSKRTTADLVEQATLLRIPTAPVQDAKGVLENEMFNARGIFVDSQDGDFKHPLPPYLIDGERALPKGPAPKLGEHTGRIEVRTPQAPVPPPRADEAEGRPLQGVRILDATAWWAGPSSTQMLALLGAEVIHLESIGRPDGARTALPGPGRWWERGGLYLGCNTNKRNVTLALDHPRGLELVHELVKHCDAVMENFSPRVFERFELDWEHVHALNPRTILVRMPAFGVWGPWRDNVGFAQTMEQMTGMAWVTGYPDTRPRIPLGPCDPNAGMHAAFAMMAALRRREETGLGSFIEGAMVESALNAASEQTIMYSKYGIILEREGNRGPDAAPQNLYACRGEEHWLALSVATDAQWQALVGLMGNPGWAADPQFATLAGRRAGHDRLDAELTGWFAHQDLDEAVERLIAAGIPAGIAQDPRLQSTHPRHVAARFFEDVETYEAGTLPIARQPFRFSRVETWNTHSAPTLGQDNDYVLRDLLGLSDDEIAELEEEGVVGQAPARV